MKAKYKSRLALILAGVIACSLLLTSCSGDNNSAVKTNSVSLTEADINDLSEKVEIVLYREGRFARDIEDDIIRQQLQKNLNIDLNINCIQTEYSSQLNVLIASGSVPDIFAVKQSQYNNFKSQGIMLDLLPYLDLMPNYKKAFPNIENDQMILDDGKMYFIGDKNQRDKNSTVKSYFSLWIRQDWLDNLGMKAPTNLDEFRDTVIAFAKNDPDKNGKDDTYGYSAVGEGVDPFPPIMGAFGVGGPNTYILKDGKAVLSSTTPEFKNALEYLRDLIATGCVDPDLLVTKTYDQLNEKIYKNQVGLVFERWSTLVKPPFDEQLKKLTPDAKWVQLEPPKGYTGLQYNDTWTVPGLVTSGYVVSSKLTENKTKLARVLKYLDYVAYGEGLELVSYGIEGVHYTKDSNGNITIIEEKSGETENASHYQTCGRNEMEYLKTKFPSLQKEIEFADKIPYLNIYNAFLVVPEGLNQSDKTKFEQEEISKFLYNKRPLSEFDDYVKTLYDVFGQQQYDDALNAKLKEYGIIK